MPARMAAPGSSAWKTWMVRVSCPVRPTTSSPLSPASGLESDRARAVPVDAHGGLRRRTANGWQQRASPIAAAVRAAEVHGPYDGRCRDLGITDAGFSVAAAPRSTHPSGLRRPHPGPLRIHAVRPWRSGADAAVTAWPPTSWPWSWTTPSRASPMWCAVRTCWTARSGRSPSATPWACPSPRLRTSRCSPSQTAGSSEIASLAFHCYHEPGRGPGMGPLRC